MKHLILVLFILIPIILFAQDPTPNTPTQKSQQLPVGNNSTASQDVQKQDSAAKPPISLYKIITVKRDTIILDTSLTIQKDYKFNYLRKDNFELLPFNNVGQTYNSLARDIKSEVLIPEFVAQARHFNFMEVEDIYYYQVPTPLTEVYFKTVPEQGQTLDAFFTMNTSERLNFSVAYKGLRSLGKYQNALTSTGNFRATFGYNTSNDRYRIKTHFVSQDLLNQENGGLSEDALQQYLDKEPEFDDRSLLEMKYENAENILYGKRFYLDQEYDLVKGTSNAITLQHILDFSDQKYIFRQDEATPEYYGASFRASNLEDRVLSRHIKNVVGVTYENSLLGKLTAKGQHSHYNYGYNSVIFLEEDKINNRIEGDNFGFGAAYEKTIGGFDIYADAMANIVGDFTGFYLTGGAGYKLNQNNQLSAEININDHAPNYNYLLYQSDYLNYNWNNDFSNQSQRSLSLQLRSLDLFNVEASINQIDNYAYFGVDESNDVKPFQYNGTVNYLKVKLGKELTYGKFALDNTVMYQNVTSGKDVFNVPDLVTRNTLYFKDHWFQRALYVQTGLTFKYFNAYNMNSYDPVLAEFYVQNNEELGGYPMVDFFFNGRVRQTRIFFKLENVNTLINGNNNFTAPSYPYRDFLVRFGLVWDFFL